MILLLGPPAGEPRNKLLIVAGQSNAIGYLVPSEATSYPGLGTPYAPVPLTDHNILAINDPGPFVDEGPRDLQVRTIGGGPFGTGIGGVELVIGRELTTRTIDTWSVGKMAISGASLVSNLNNPAWPTVPPSMKDQFSTFIADQIATRDILDPSIDLAVVWIQGESDIGYAEATYLSNLQSLFGDLRTRFGNFKIVLNRCHISVDNVGHVRAAQQAFADTTDGVSIIYNDDLTLDGPHFVSDSLAILGMRFSDALIGAMYP